MSNDSSPRVIESSDDGKAGLIAHVEEWKELMQSFLPDHLALDAQRLIDFRAEPYSFEGEQIVR
jgi:hypothetical protein